MIENLLSRIENPRSEYRGFPFYSLNADLKPDEMRRQAHIFKEMGCGGFFLHSRVGLENPYLGKDFMNALRASIEECEKLGLHPWLYDEDRWPSGAAGGLVTKNPEYRMRHLKAEKVSSSDSIQDHEGELTLAWFALDFADQNVLKSYRRIQKDDSVQPNEQKYRFFREIDHQRSWFNDQTYLDTLNPEAVQEFIRVTHEAYYHEFGSYFGNLVPGIFTDEPTYQQGNTLPWTDKLPSEYEKNYGESLLDYLPELLYSIQNEEFSKIRLQYFNTATNLFYHSFMKQIYDWCREHHLKFTGHFLCEDFLTSQTRCTGSAMRGYVYEDIPGMDLLTEHRMLFDAAKQCSSVAHQFGKEFRITETYGCTGWDFPFFGHKALGDWQYALGINFRCQHLAWYSMKGEAKRDYPACIFEPSPWYKKYHYVEDYFARLGEALHMGEEQRSILVIHPIESTWGVFAWNNFP